MKKNSFSAIWLLVFGCILLMASLLMIFQRRNPPTGGSVPVLTRTPVIPPDGLSGVNGPAVILWTKSLREHTLNVPFGSTVNLYMAGNPNDIRAFVDYGNGVGGDGRHDFYLGKLYPSFSTLVSGLIFDLYTGERFFLGRIAANVQGVDTIRVKASVLSDGERVELRAPVTAEGYFLVPLFKLNQDGTTTTYHYVHSVAISNEDSTPFPTPVKIGPYGLDL
jgi:hypothetical protein